MHDEQIGRWYRVPPAFRQRRSWKPWLGEIAAYLSRGQNALREAGVETLPSNAPGRLRQDMLVVSSHVDRVSWPELVFRHDPERIKIVAPDEVSFETPPDVPILYVPETNALFQDWVARIRRTREDHWIAQPEHNGIAPTTRRDSPHVLGADLSCSQVPLVLDAEDTHAQVHGRDARHHEH